MPLLPALALLVLAGGFFAWVYYRREFAVRGRALLLAARLLALAGVLAILWNPDVPAAAGRAVSERFVILDASASMSALSTTGEPVWASATARARAMAQEGARVLVAGAEPFGAGLAAHPDSLATLSPSGHESVLAPALGTAAEAGAREIVLVTDRRVADPVAVAAAARRLGVRVEVDSAVAAPAPNLAVSRLVLPAAADSGRALRGTVHVEGRAPGDSVDVVVTVDGRVAQLLRLPAPAADGETTSAPFVLPGSLSPGPRRVSARLTAPDSYPPDDQRVRIVHVDAQDAGIVLVSFAPDWEPRFLLPVLRQVTGLPVRGYVRAGPNRFQAMGDDGRAPGAPGGTTGPPGPLAVDRAELERRIGQAVVVVAMGVDASEREFLDRAAGRASGLAVFPTDADGAAAGGVAAGEPQGGEWYASAAPASPISVELGQFLYGGLPPLSEVLPVADPGGGAMEVRLGGTGEPRPALILRRAAGGRRVVVVLARGFWRWAFRDGEPRDRYRLLWGAVGGWLLGGESATAGADVSPETWVAPPGRPVWWRARDIEGGEVRLSVTDSTGAAVLDSTWTVSPTGVFATPALPPGPYRYAAEPVDPGESGAPNAADAVGPPGAPVAPAPAATAGLFEVESFTREALRRPVEAPRLAFGLAASPASHRRVRPLRTLPWPYLVVLAALCAEWAGRRRAGLR